MMSGRRRRWPWLPPEKSPPPPEIARRGAGVVALQLRDHALDRAARRELHDRRR